ncbi:MAG TPA: ATP-grasp domain-containing protein, partial [Thermomicrobiaceae bacterium]|nr:ATP-grasp domain-containing protein [Thermomicrobiaceae bacterium]
MGRILEHHAKELIGSAGVPVPRGAAAASAEGARVVAAELAVPVVVKALVPVGKRGKAGAVRPAATPAEAARAAAGLLGRAVGGYPVEQVLVEERLAIRRELYLSLSIDREACAVRLLLGAEGGVEIEELSRAAPETLVDWLIPPGERLPEFRARALWRRAGIGGPLLPKLGRLTALLADVFVRLDAVLLEINPLVETDADELVAAGTVLAVDDGALFRHPELEGRVLVA